MALKLKSICSQIEDYINNNEDFTKKPGRETVVKVTELGASSIDITILCYTEFVNFSDFLTIKQNLVFEIISVVSNNGSDFAFPSRSLYFENQNNKEVVQKKE